MSTDPWSHEADMSGPQWERRTHRPVQQHAQGWRDQQPADDRLDAARGIVTALALTALLWVVFGGLALWAIELLVTP